MQLPKFKSDFQKPSGLLGARRFFLFLIGTAAFSIIVSSCRPDTQTSEGGVIRTAEQNAPLAVLMREMYVDMEEIKGAVVEKEKIGSYLQKHRGLLTAKATDPEVRDSSFHIMANAYLLHLERMEQSSQGQMLENFQALQQSCIACHQQKCPGPLKKINTLKFN